MIIIIYNNSTILFYYFIFICLQHVFNNKIFNYLNHKLVYWFKRLRVFIGEPSKSGSTKARWFLDPIVRADCLTKTSSLLPTEPESQNL